MKKGARQEASRTPSELPMHTGTVCIGGGSKVDVCPGKPAAVVGGIHPRPVVTWRGFVSSDLTGVWLSGKVATRVNLSETSIA